MRDLLSRQRAGEVLVFDGAMGSLLLAAGLEPGRAPETLTLSRPDLIGDIARQYLAAGADIVQTNTFGASPLRLAAHGLAGRTDEINRRAVEIAREAVGERALIAGSCGPTGTLLKPYGDADPADVRSAFELQTTALIAAGVDLICVETMTDLEEARLAIAAARSVDAGVPVVATMTFDPTPRGYFTVMGVTIEVAARELVAAGADVIGSNCGNGFARMVEIAAEFRRHTDHPLIFQPNAGMPEIEDGRAVYRETPAFFAAHTEKLLDLDVFIVGGCCGTTPEHVRAVRERVDARRAEPG